MNKLLDTVLTKFNAADADQSLGGFKQNWAQYVVNLSNNNTFNLGVLLTTESSFKIDIILWTLI